MYENKKQALASKRLFYRRLFRNLFIASAILAVCLLIGVLGYHYIAHLEWIEAVHNASMILSGMELCWSAQVLEHELGFGYIMAVGIYFGNMLW